MIYKYIKMKMTALLARQVSILGQDAAMVGMAMDQNDPEEFQSSANGKVEFCGWAQSCYFELLQGALLK